MKSDKAIIIGSLNYDIILKQKRLPQIGETLTADSITMCGGGKGANQAVQLAKLGGKAFMAGCVGKDTFGSELLSNLGKYNVDTRYIKKSETNTGMGIVNVLEDGKLIATITKGANYDIIPEDIDKFKSDISDFGIMILQMEIPMETIEYSINFADEHDIFIILNAAPALPVKDEILKKVNCLVVNETEASYYLGLEISDLNSAAEHCEELFKKIKDILIITLGENGSLLYDGKNKYHIPARKVNVVETTGAGDSFIGAFAYKLMQNSTFEEAASFASLVSAVTVTGIGAQDSMPTYNELEKYIK